MAIIVNFAGASLKKPGAYSRIKVAQGGAAEAQLGIVALVGEADSGLQYSADTLEDVVFSPEQFGSILDKYGSGPIVDAARLALTPSNDPQIVGGAQQLILMVTNALVKASLTLAGAYGVIKDKKGGADGNKIAIQIDNALGQRVITITDAKSGQSEVSSAIGGVTALSIQALSGTSCTMSISATHLTTVPAGVGAPAALNLKLTDFSTIQDMADYINTITGYTAVVGTDQANNPPSILDRVTAVDIFTALYAILRDAYDIQQFFASSGLVDFTPGVSGYVGLPAVLVKTFLAGGARGATTNANVQGALDQLLKFRVNFIVPLFSRDASSDITDGLTDSLSSYTIDSVNAATKTHVKQASTVKGKKERQGFVSYKGTFSATKSKSLALNCDRLQMVFQNVDVLDSSGELFTAQPFMLAVIAAGMKAAAVVGLPNTFKLVNVNGFSHPSFDPEVDHDPAIDANLTFLEKAPGGGFRFVLDNSTYGQVKDAWVYARPSVVYAGDVAAYSIRLNTETFVGQRNSDVSRETVKNLLITVMDALRSSGIIVPDANTAGKGFKDMAIDIVGSVIKVNVTLALVEGYEFVLNDILVQRAVQ
jgi:hypothetical protein